MIEISGASLETYLTSLKAPHLEPNMGISSSNQCTESVFFRLGPFGSHLQPPQCYCEEQIFCLTLPTMTYSLGHTHNPLGHNPTTIGHILYPVIFGKTFALVKSVDSEHKRELDLRKGREASHGKIM